MAPSKDSIFHLVPSTHSNAFGVYNTCGDANLSGDDLIRAGSSSVAKKSMPLNQLGPIYFPAIRVAGEASIQLAWVQ